MKKAASFGDSPWWTKENEKPYCLINFIAEVD
jgi:hypothetical protein